MRASSSAVGLAIGVFLAIGGGWLALALRPHATALYVDCARSAPGDGTIKSPWSRLTLANQASLKPGTQLLLRRGTVCHGSLAPRGSGSANKRAVMGAYGRGPAPRIQTDGLAADALHLSDQSHILVRDLELTSRGDFTTARRGVHVLATRPGTVRDIVLSHLYVHDVDGADNKDLGGSGGIQVDQPSADVLIEDNVVKDVNRSGIWVVGSGRDPRPPAGNSWPSATTGVVIRGNRVTRAGGDGIVPTGTAGAVVSDNVVCCSNLRGRAPSQFDAGIWTFDADGTVIARNEVYAMRNGKADGTGYDIDYNQDGTVVEDNYGHDNAGGFMLLCTNSQPQRTAEIRFNLSVDEYVFNQAQCKLENGKIGTLDGLRVYNNTFLTPSSLIWNDAGAPRPSLPNAGSFSFLNNILYASRQQKFPFPCGSHCSHNLFFAIPPSGDSAVGANPLFVNPRRRGMGRLAVGKAFKLRRGSRGIRGGTSVLGSPTSDYFGGPVSSPPWIGFSQGS